MATTISTGSSANLSVRWEEQYVSRAINRKYAGINTRGIVRGGRIKTAGSGLFVSIDPDAIGDSIYVFEDRTNGFSIAYRETGTVNLDLTSVASTTVYLALYVDYTVGAASVVEWRTYSESELFGGSPVAEADEVVIVGKIVVPASGPIAASDVTPQRARFAWDSASPGSTPWKQVIGNGSFDLAKSGASSVGVDLLCAGWRVDIANTISRALISNAAPLTGLQEAQFSFGNSYAWSNGGSLGTSTANDMLSATVIGTRIVASGATGADVAFYSDDYGVSWTPATTPPADYVQDMVTIGSRVVGVASDGKCYYSDDNGDTWSSSTINVSYSFYGTTVIGSRVVAVGDSGKVYYSDTSGTSWTAATTTSTTRMRDVTVIGTRLVAVGDSSKAVYSDDNGATWSANVSIGGTDAKFTIVTSGTRLATLGNSGSAYYSDDNGASWSAATGSGASSFRGAVVAGSRIYAFGILGALIYYSDDNGGTWSSEAIPTATTMVAGVYTDQRVVVVGSDTESILVDLDDGFAISLAASGMHLVSPDQYIRGEFALRFNALTYTPVSALIGLKFDFYDSAMSFLSTSDVSYDMSGFSSPMTAAYATVDGCASVPASAEFMRVRLSAEDSGTGASGSIYFDDVRVHMEPLSQTRTSMEQLESLVSTTELAIGKSDAATQADLLDSLVRVFHDATNGFAVDVDKSMRAGTLGANDWSATFFGQLAGTRGLVGGSTLSNTAADSNRGRVEASLAGTDTAQRYVTLFRSTDEPDRRRFCIHLDLTDSAVILALNADTTSADAANLRYVINGTAIVMSFGASGNGVRVTTAISGGAGSVVSLTDANGYELPRFYNYIAASTGTRLLFAETEDANDTASSRIYMSSNGLEVTHNARWDDSAALWYVDSASVNPILLRMSNSNFEVWSTQSTSSWADTTDPSGSGWTDRIVHDSLAERFHNAMFFGMSECAFSSYKQPAYKVINADGTYIGLPWTSVYRMWYSRDLGSTWDMVESTANGVFDASIYVNGRIVTKKNSTTLVDYSDDFGFTWSTASGAASASYYPLKIIVTTSGRLMYVSDGTAYYSDDDGATWSTVSVTISGCVNLTFLPSVGGSGRIIVAGTSSTAYSDNDGSTWTSVAVTAGINITMIDTNDDDSVVVMSNKYGDVIYYSTTSGTSWTAATTAFGSITPNYLTDFSHGAGTTWIATSSYGVVYKSTDDGDNWAALDSAKYVGKYIVKANNRVSLFGASGHMGGASSVMSAYAPVSTGSATHGALSGDLTFIYPSKRAEIVPSGKDTNTAQINTICAIDNYVFAGGDGVLMYNMHGGSIFESSNSLVAGYNIIDSVAGAADVYFACGSDGYGIMSSPIFASSVPTMSSSHAVNAVAVDTNGTTFYGIGPTGDFFDSSGTWTSPTATGYSGPYYVLMVSGTRIIAFGTGIIYSDNGGSTWTQCTGYGGTGYTYTRAVAYRGYLYATTSGGGRVSVSTNNGTTWSQKYASGNSIGYLNLDDEMMFMYGGAYGWKTIDGGTFINLGAQANPYVYMKYVSGKVYAVDENNRVWVSLPIGRRVFY